MNGRGKDRVLLIAVIVLTLFGLMMVSSASAINSYQNTSGLSSQYYLWHQLGAVVVSFVALGLVQLVPARLWRQLATPAYAASLIGLILVLAIGQKSGTFAKSWIYIAGVSVQPSEFAKLGLILYLSAYMAKQGPAKTADFKHGFLSFGVITGLVILLTMLQPDLGTSLIMLVIGAAIYFVAGANLLHIFLGMTASAMGAFVIMRSVTRVAERFTAFLNPSLYPLGIGYQIEQALIAVGSGGIIGRGFGLSRQKFEYLPEAQGDSIFAIIAEELGLIRTLFLVLIPFAVIAWRGYTIAEKTKDPFTRYVAVGITTWISFQAFINIFVIIALFPTTGVPLPFISYGGTALLANCIGIGILLTLSGDDTPTTNSHDWRWQRGTRYARPRRRPLFRRKGF